MIETKRLILRSLTQADAADVFEYSNVSDVGRDAGWKPHETMEETRELLNLIFVGREDIFGIEEKKTGKLIGTVGLMPDTTRENEGARTLGYALGKPYWGQGLMTESVQGLLVYAFEERGYDLISVSHYTDNHSSARVIEKCGFHFEGIQRQAELRFDGVMKDKKWYSMTKNEFVRK